MSISQEIFPGCCDMRFFRTHAAERCSFWKRFRELIFKGFLSRKLAGSAPKPFPLILELERGKVVWVCNDEVDLVCRSGLLWITRGDQRDLILTSGESLKVNKDQRALVHALLDARFTLQPWTHSPAQRAAQEAINTLLGVQRVAALHVQLDESLEALSALNAGESDE